MTPVGDNVGLMQTLGFASTQTLYWDSSNSQDFYMRDTSVPATYRLSPKEAAVWFCNQGTALTTIYNPFIIGYPQLYLQFPYKDVD